MVKGEENGMIAAASSTTVPGCRVPHVWLEGRRSLYDAMGTDYTLLRLDPALDTAIQAAGLSLTPTPRGACRSTPWRIW